MATGVLLQRALRTGAQSALVELSSAFLRLRMSAIASLSLASGLPGIALVHATLDQVFPEAGHRACAQKALERTLQQLGKAPMRPGLHTGIAGIGWVVQHLASGDGDEEEEDDLCAPFDVEIERLLNHEPWTASYEVIDGLAGLGVYALERIPRASATRMLSRVVGHLTAMGELRSPGIAWRTNPSWRSPPLQSSQPLLNLGVAHGVPGVIAFLGRVVGARVDTETRERARALLGRAIAWLLAQELPENAEGCFSYGAAQTESPEAARLAWCYGDPGVAAALLVAARGAGEPDWEREAVRIGLRAAARPEARAGVEDAGLCHGSSGVAHLFHRLYRATGEKRFAAASRAWFARTLAMRRPGRAFAGFLTREAAGGKPSRDPGFLTGAAGIALALAAAVEDLPSEWNRVLLLP